jgi:hypothetical protein
MTLGEGGRKRSTLTKHKMSTCAQASKRVPVHFYQKIVKWFEMTKNLLLWVKCKVGFISQIWVFISYVW